MSMLKKLVLVMALATSMTLLAATMALAAGQYIPHGGYSTLTDACLQCHDVHEAGSDYVLMRWETVLDTCGSCHFLYLGQYPSTANGSTGAGTYLVGTATPGSVPKYDPGYDLADLAAGDPQWEVDTTNTAGSPNDLGSRTSAYEVPWGQRTSHNGHTLQRGPGNYVHADGVNAPGDYIPGGQVPLTAIEEAAYPETVNALSFTGTNGLNCASCHTPHGNYGQQLLDATGVPVNGKLLSGKPNHNRNGPGDVALSIDDWASGGGDWCGECHVNRLPGAIDPDTGDVAHNHPESFCLQCHANDVYGQSSDWPHTSFLDNLLAEEPDGLCIECHKMGLLP